MIATFCADENRWRPIELRSVEDVKLLNELLSDGWRLESLDLEGLPFLAFCGRTGDEIYLTPRLRRDDDGPNRLLLILQRSKPGQQSQRAAFVERGSGGYMDMAGQRRGAHDARFVGIFPIGDNATVTIYEMK